MTESVGCGQAVQHTVGGHPSKKELRRLLRNSGAVAPYRTEESAKKETIGNSNENYLLRGNTLYFFFPFEAMIIIYRII